MYRGKNAYIVPLLLKYLIELIPLSENSIKNEYSVNKLV